MKYWYVLTPEVEDGRIVRYTIVVRCIAFSDYVLYATLCPEDGLVMHSTGFGIDPLDWKGISSIFLSGIKEAAGLLGIVPLH